MPTATHRAVRAALTDIGAFTRLQPNRLRTYQLEPARGITQIDELRGELLCMVFSRQAGKDETLAQILAYLLLRHARSGGSIVVGAPTRDPQANISRDRLLLTLRTNPLTRPLTRVSDGYKVHVGEAHADFLSAAPGSNARGHTASILLVANEAQDIDVATWDAVFDPMAASTNAPTLFLGTVWTEDTLLHRQMTYARELEARDGKRRLWFVPWERVASELPDYGERVKARIRQLGEDHPFIRTEYMLIPLSGTGGLFTDQRQRLMSGTHPRRREPFAGETIAFLIDVAGADEDAIDQVAGFDPQARRDSTVLTIVSVTTTEPDKRYTVLDRVAWTNVPWATIKGAIAQLMRTWNPAATVIDATGIGYGLWSHFHTTERGRRIYPFTFSMATKSDLGWKVLGIIDSGRLQDYARDGADDTEQFWWQVGRTSIEILPGPARRIRFGVDPRLGHDDMVLSMMLVGVLEDLDLAPRRARGS